MNRMRRRLIDRSRAARDGRRMHAFYQGFWAQRAGRATNPHAHGSELAQCWDAGWKYAELEAPELAEPPVCRFGPGGEFTKDWPEVPHDIQM